MVDSILWLVYFAEERVESGAAAAGQESVRKFEPLPEISKPSCCNLPTYALEDLRMLFQM